MNARVLLASLALGLPATALGQELPQKLDIDTAVKLALQQAPGLGAAGARAEAASAQADSVRGRLLPSFFVSDEQQRWDSPFSIAFGAPGAPPFTLRDQDTNTFVAAANQPLLGLLHLTQDHAALGDVAEAAQETRKSVESTVREMVETAYLRLFEARAMVAVAQSSEAQLAEQRNLAQARLNAGVITNADVLRIATAQANAKLQEVQAQAQADATEQALLVALGYPPGAKVEFADPASMVDQAAPQSDEAAVQQQALSGRHEVAAARHQLSAAAHQERSALYKLLPEADLEAGYTHIEGQVFAPPNSEFVGIKASWPVFTWGADWFAYKSASANAQAAELAAEDQSRTVRTDAVQKLSQVRAASSAVELANTAIASAEEAYRVTNAQVKAGVATSTSDLLDAQSALTQAKLQLARAKYERAIAVIALRRATGG